ncbi:MAG: flavoprotein [Tepidisphaeraceae bacterium]|jgi:phosphopantothenoylcysteine decarboxylase/phosphopantothenate--cysteine ligase
MSPSQPNAPDPSLPPLPLKEKEIVVAVCGGIAAYKVADAVSKLVQRGAGVTVVMTESATRFVGPLTFQALSGRPVRTSIWDALESGDTRHIALTDHASLMLVAPATANVLAKTAAGICDDLVSTMICAAACPVVFAPAMNARMWANPITRENVAKLVKLGYRMIGPEAGWLACRTIGQGRMAEATAIVEEVTTIVLSAPGAGMRDEG